MTSSQPFEAVLKSVHFENASAIFNSLNFTRTHSSTLSRRTSINRYHIGRKKLFSFSNLWRLINDSTVLKRWVSPIWSFALCKFPLYVSKTISVWLPVSSKRPVGLVVWFSLRVREVPGSTPGQAHVLDFLLGLSRSGVETRINFVTYWRYLRRISICSNVFKNGVESFEPSVSHIF